MAPANLPYARLQRFVRRRKIDIFVGCWVVPKKNGVVRKAAKRSRVLWLTPRVELGVGIDYPNPKTIGADRLANAAAGAAVYGSPAIVVDFAPAGPFNIGSAQPNYTAEGVCPR